MTKAEELVAKGATLLDEKLPDWFAQIDTDSLEMASECFCVLGQLGGNKVNLDKLGFEPDEWVPDEADGFTKMCQVLEPRADEIGCDAVWEGLDTDQVHLVITFEDLRAAWLVEIEKRRAV